ncbi:MAG: cobalt-precorrin-6A reductase [Selenomonadaceae bacterium]|nr:cobalt-precorrin-6A reductase [Selenomonadaceae bacterium]
MIFVAAGTQDGRELAGRLLSEGYPVTASVVSKYGSELLAMYPGMKINDKPLDEEGLSEYIKSHDIRVFVDASHPYAANVSQNAMNACRKAKVPYIRYERQATAVNCKKLTVVENYEQAAEAAVKHGKTIFLTTGSRNIQKFLQSPYLAGCRIVARILPTADVISEVTSLGLSPKDIIAMQGPFSREFNREMFRQYSADVIITKNSGSIGGTDTKFSAADDLGLPVILVDKPAIKYDNLATDFDTVIKFVAGQINLEVK